MSWQWLIPMCIVAAGGWVLIGSLMVWVARARFDPHVDDEVPPEWSDPLMLVAVKVAAVVAWPVVVVVFCVLMIAHGVGEAAAKMSREVTR